ncbi:MAG: A/G-specific adenine glycosylase [Rhizobiaceae bacterium]
MSSSIRAGRKPAAFAARLLAWYDRHHRELPWRVSPKAFAAGERPDPYRVWLSEVMLQQTTVEAVKPFYGAFLDRWPAVADLAAAQSDDVMRAWAGLGYYSRARNLLKCARAVVEQHGGRFPEHVSTLRTLPGIGAYTAAAVAAIAFGRREAVVDGNVERVIARHRAIGVPYPAVKREIGAIVAALTPGDRSGDFAQAMMDLGATVCSPRRPSCLVCPVSEDCEGLAKGNPEQFPLRSPKPARPVRRGAAFVAIRPDGAVLLRQRPESGLLGGMTEVPTSSWNASMDGDTTPSAAPFPADWTAAGQIIHVFTHFELRLDVYRARASLSPPPGTWWSGDPASEALPTVMRKALAAATDGASRQSASKRPKGNR